MWGFFQGLLPNFLTLALLNHIDLDQEANSGKLAS
jgi:hypothetical protein